MLGIGDKDEYDTKGNKCVPLIRAHCAMCDKIGL